MQMRAGSSHKCLPVEVAIATYAEPGGSNFHAKVGQRQIGHAETSARERRGDGDFAIGLLAGATLLMGGAPIRWGATFISYS